jgi:spermidine synthase
MIDSGRTWYTEAVAPNLFQTCSVRSILYTGRTAYQSVQLLDTGPFGRVLVLDGKTQSGEVDEAIYHEALVHPAMILHPHPRRVFIAGGGEGATLREVLAHTTVEKAVMVDIDGEVVELCKRFLPSHHRGAFDDPRAELHLTDAAAYLRNTAEPFDVAILDLPDPLEGGPAALLFTREFYALVRDRLTEAGIVATQAGPASLGLTEEMATVHATLAAVFPHVASYRAEVLSFGVNWAFTVASKGEAPAALPPQEVDRRIGQRMRLPPATFDGLTYQGMLALPKYLREALGRQGRVATEVDPARAP